MADLCEELARAKPGRDSSLSFLAPWRLGAILLFSFPILCPGVLIFALALATRLAWVLTLGQSLSWPDEQEFVDIARHLAAGDGYISTSYRANPVLPVYLVAMFTVFGDSYLAARIGQAVLGALTCVFIYRTASLAVSRPVGILSGLLAALYLPHIYLSGVFYVECVFMFLASLSVYSAVRLVRGDAGLLHGIECGIACGLTILTRPIFAAYLPFLCLAWIYAAWPRWRRQMLICSGLVVATTAVILPWTARNYVVYRRLIPVTSGFWTTLWQGNNPLALGDADDRLTFPMWQEKAALALGEANDRLSFWNNRYWADRIQRLPKAERQTIEVQYSEVDRLVQDSLRDNDRYLATDGVLKPVVIDYIIANPGRTLALFLKKIVTLFSAFTQTETTNQHTSGRARFAAAAVFYPMLALAVAGTLLGLQENRTLAVVYAFIVSMVVTYAALTACTRFRLAMDPYLIIFTSLALVRFSEVLATVTQRTGWYTRPAAGVVVCEQAEMPLQGADAPFRDLL